ncbi:MAG: hypothetical protein B7Y39_12455 [Bdellovibrio sp. 28-41-41]|nr:MAG: hypothetical protein B7Y39_12455 [Bdellovibrio sp. 28-41-41]
MKYTETEEVLHIKGFDLEFCLLNGLSAFVISLVGLYIYFLFSQTPYAGAEFFGITIFAVSFSCLVYLFLGYKFFEIFITARSIKINFLWRVWKIENGEIKIRVQNSYRPTGWIITFYFESGRISLPVLKNDKALEFIEKMKIHYKKPITIIDHQYSKNRN